MGGTLGEEPRARGDGFSRESAPQWGVFQHGCTGGGAAEPLEPRPPGLVGRQGQGAEVRPHCWSADPEYDHHGKTFWREGFLR